MNKLTPIDPAPKVKNRIFEFVFAQKSFYCNLLTCRDRAVRQREIIIWKNILNFFQRLSQTQLMDVGTKCVSFNTYNLCKT